MKIVRPSELINDESFIREVVDDVCDEIKRVPLDKIILTGGRGIGKSAILYNLEDREISHRNPFIYTHFDSVVSFSQVPNNVFSDEFHRHYYEVILSLKILNYLKRKYPLIYDTHFKGADSIVRTSYQELIGFGRGHYRRSLIFFKTGVLVKDILDLVREVLKLETINLAIDRFDWTNGRSIYTENLLSNYFPMFDKTVITSDDASLEERKETIEEQGFKIIKPTYSQDLNFIRFLIINNCDDEVIKSVLRTISDEDLKNLITFCSGNIKAMLSIINELESKWRFYKGSLDVSKELQTETKRELERIRQVDSVSVPPKFYL